MKPTGLAVVLAALALLGVCVDSARGSADAAALANCGVSVRVAGPPARAVTLNQAATEVMFALGLQDRLVGTAYLDDQILPAFATAYRRVPVLAAEYPAREVLLAARPDFLYAAYPGAFGPTGVGSRPDWKAHGVDSYLSPGGCLDKRTPPSFSIDATFQELRDIGRIFGVSDRAEALIASYQADLRAIRDRIGPIARSPRVFWYDAGDPPRVGACCGAPNEILQLVGATNVFADTPGSWTAVSWESVIARNPDVIVLANASWSTAAEKRTLLTTRKALAGIDAVRRGRIVVIDFGHTTPGIRNVDAVRRLAEALYPYRFQ